MPRAPLAEPAAFVACRTLGHSWDQLPVEPGGPVGQTHTTTGVWLRLRCVRCSMERYDEVSRSTGFVEYRRYIQPDGYHRSSDDYMARDEWRYAFLRLTGVVKQRTKARDGKVDGTTTNGIK